MIGRAGTAPCGCPGEHVVGQYVECLQGCDQAGAGPESCGVPEPVDLERTEPICPHCGSDDVGEYVGASAVIGKSVYHCHDCQKGFMS